jgi:hypothetical protein
VRRNEIKRFHVNFSQELYLVWMLKRPKDVSTSMDNLSLAKLPIGAFLDNLAEP